MAHVGGEPGLALQVGPGALAAHLHHAGAELLSDDTFDHVICGGGSAGCVLASRLSATGRRVALVEAGQDTPPGKEPADIRSSYHGPAVYNPAYIWKGLKVQLRPVPHNRPEAAAPLRALEQARVLGGGSSINGQLANRGLPTDYDGWAREGAAGWSWSDVLPFFRKLETDLDFGETDLHGGFGPIPIRRIPKERWAGHSKAFAAALSEAGLPELPDQNGDFRDGWFAITTANAAADHRVSAAMAYLTAEVRARPNLTVLTGHDVLGLEFDGDGRANGVRVRAATGEARTLRTRGDIVLSMGALRSPAFLMTQGIGPAEILRENGIEPRMILPGVGRNLQDHPTVGFAAYLRRPHRQIGPLGRNIHVGVRWSSALEGVPAGDLFAISIARTSWHPVGERLAGMQAWLNRSYTGGRVRLRSPNPMDHPVAELEMLSDPRDAQRAMTMFRSLAAWHAQPALRAVAVDAFPMVYNEAVRKVAVKNLKNAVSTAILGRILDGPGSLRRAAIHGLITEASPVAVLMADDEALETHVRNTCTGQWHVSCTCKMGGDDDPMAVTDPSGRVRGVPGLRVCDASVFPYVPCANTNIPTIMTAEKISDAILHDR
ncbi:GMC family oxidoreductase [Roseomonas sp. CCTCC AB2023176]|uniref:GMC family oxidoreductase n=1 Tax=Roseomonas sp. CCTCC AB2023176 TaxID=3342640 RepID=UPI0035DBC5B9